MILKIKKTVEEEIEVTFPAYREYGSSLYKIENEKKRIGVNVSVDTPLDEDIFSSVGIEIKTGYNVETILVEGRKIEKAAFDNAFQKALAKINRYWDTLSELRKEKQDELSRDELEQSRGKSQEEADEDMIEDIRRQDEEDRWREEVENESSEFEL